MVSRGLYAGQSVGLALSKKGVCERHFSVLHASSHLVNNSLSLISWVHNFCAENWACRPLLSTNTRESGVAAPQIGRDKVCGYVGHMFFYHSSTLTPITAGGKASDGLQSYPSQAYMWLPACKLAWTLSERV